MFNFLKKKEKVNKIKERIQSLNDKLWLISIVGKNFDVESRSRYCRGLNFNYYENYKVFTLDTTFGKRQIAVSKNSLYYGFENMIKVQGTNSIKWSFDFDYIFMIHVTNSGDTLLKPFPFTGMTKEEVDLAILEFEEAIDKIYSKVIELKNVHIDTISYLTKH